MSTTTCKNLAEPLFLDITYNNLSSDGLSAPSWGIEVGIGMPIQKFSLWPSIWNHTFLSNAGHCIAGNDACLSSEGGIYDPELSRTENVSTVSTWNGTIGSEDPSYYYFYNDILTFGPDETTVLGFPFTTDDGAEWSLGSSVGLGPNSSFLQVAVESGAAPSMSWGLWVGSRSIENPLDGLLLIGGYDDARVANEFSVFESRPECPACIQVQDLAWVTDAGTIPLTNTSTTDFQVSLNPYYNQIQIPQALYEAFGVATNGLYDEYLGTYTYPASAVPSGSLSFTIKNGYTTTIGADELFRFPREYDNDGNLVIANDTYQQAWVYNYTNEYADEANYLYTWGLPFLSMNYLVMDIEERQFRLSDAIRQDFGAEGGVALRKLCTGTPEPPEETGSKGTNVGALVGGIIGGVAGLLIIAAGIWFCWRKRRNHHKQPTGPAGPAYDQTSHPPAPPSHVMYPGPPLGPYGGPMPTSYPGQPPAGYPFMTQVEYPKAHQGGYHFNPSSPPLPQAKVSSVIYSDTATTAVQELPSPDLHASEWRGSQIGSDIDPAKTMQATITSPVQTSYRER